MDVPLQPILGVSYGVYRLSFGVGVCRWSRLYLGCSYWCLPMGIGAYSGCRGLLWVLKCNIGVACIFAAPIGGS